MLYDEIRSRRNPRIVEAAKLRRRRVRHEKQRFLVDAPHPLDEAIRAGAEIEAVFVTESFCVENSQLLSKLEKSGSSICVVTPEIMGMISQTKNSQGVAAVLRFVDLPLDEALRRDPVVIADGIADPGNLGTVLRSARAAAFKAAIITASSADVYNAKAVRSSAGGIFGMSIATSVAGSDAVKEMDRHGIRVLGATARGGVDFRSADYSRPVAVAIGNESSGLGDEIASRVDTWVTIPMVEGESLNAGIAASLICYEAARQGGAFADAATAKGGLDVARILSAANHDLRSPLTSVRGFATTLSRRWDSLDEETRREMAGQIAEGGNRLSRSITDLVDIARLEIGALKASSVSFDLAATCRRVVESASAAHPDAEIEIASDGEPVEAYADPARSEQIIETLVSNAVKHGGGRAAISVSSSDGMAELSVADGGPPTTDEGIAECFSADLDARERKGQPSAIGLSLHVGRRIARLQGGDLRGESAKGGGALFTLTLPLADGGATDGA